VNVLADFSTLTSGELKRLSALTKLPDAEVERLTRTGEMLAALEFAARWEVRRALWVKYRVGPEPPEQCPMTPGLRAWLARESARAPRTRKHSQHLSLAGRGRS